MKSINPDPLTPDQAIDILHRVAAAEGAPIFKDCADLIVRLHMDNFLLTKHRDEFDRLHDEARAQCDSLRTQNEALTKEVARLADEGCQREHCMGKLRTQNRELHAALFHVMTQFRSQFDDKTNSLVINALATEVKP